MRRIALYALLLLLSTRALQANRGPAFGVRARGVSALTASERSQLEKRLDALRTNLVSHAPPGLKLVAQDLERAVKHLTLGPPSEITSTRDKQLLPRPRYVSRYSARQEIPGNEPEVFGFGADWVSFVTIAKDVGNPERPRNAWTGETNLPQSFPRLVKRDWEGVFPATQTSQFDEDGITRGHMADSGASTFDSAEMRSTYTLMTNGLPQWKDNNAGAWHTLERDVRELANRGYAVYQVAGPIWRNFTYQQLDGTTVTVRPMVLGHKIPVPTAFWKVAVAVPTKDQLGRELPLAEALADARVFSVAMPNAKDAGIFASDWTRFSTTARALEKQTGLRFFSYLPERIRSALLDHHDRREGFDVGIELPFWKVSQLRRIRDLGGSEADERAALELLQTGRITQRAPE